jgi:hypothetical protein
MRFGQGGPKGEGQSEGQGGDAAEEPAQGQAEGSQAWGTAPHDSMDSPAGGTAPALSS